MKVENGKIVKFSYILKDGNGNLLDQSDKNGPLTYVHGMQMIIPGLEKKLENLKMGERFDAVIIPSEGYGERSDDNIVQYDKAAFGEINNLAIGMQLVVNSEYGEQIVTVSKMENDQVWLDTNHPLAGVTLHFNGQIESIEEMTEEMIEQLSQQHSHGCGDGCCGGSDHADHDCCGGHGDDHGCGGGCGSHK